MGEERRAAPKAAQQTVTSSAGEGVSEEEGSLSHLQLMMNHVGGSHGKQVSDVFTTASPSLTPFPLLPAFVFLAPSPPFFRSSSLSRSRSLSSLVHFFQTWQADGKIEVQDTTRNNRVRRIA